MQYRPSAERGLIQPHGGVLKELLVAEERATELKREAVHLPSWDLSPRQICDLELLLNGGFSPLDGFLCKEDYDAVCCRMRLWNGTLWPMPITLDVTSDFADPLSSGHRFVLRHPEGMVLAVLTVVDVWEPDRQAEAEQIFGTSDEAHPGVFALLHKTNPVYVGGKLEGVELPPQHTFKNLRHTPRQIREVFERGGWSQVVAFHSRDPMHLAHVEFTKRAAAETGANLLIHPVVGPTEPGDIDYFVQVRCYQAAIDHYPADSAMLSLLPLAMHTGSSREGLWHAIIRKNYGASHFIMGRDRAESGDDRDGNGFYPSYGSQKLLRVHAQELGIAMVSFQEMFYVEDMGRYVTRPEVPEGARMLSLSDSEFRRLLSDGETVPAWFSYPEVVEELRRSYPPRRDQGFTVFFTGLPSSGKSTLANVLLSKLMEEGSRPVTLLDGDVVRKHLSSELGFSREHRDLNIRRIGYVASEITKNRGIAICAPIAPYAATRREVREMIEAYGGFAEVHVATALEVCEERDRKGLYAKARARLITGFTGVDDPYEPPECPDVRVDTEHTDPEEGVEDILSFLRRSGYLVEGSGSDPVDSSWAQQS